MLDLGDVLEPKFAAAYATNAYKQPRNPADVANDGDKIDKLDGDYVGPEIRSLISAEILQRGQTANNAADAISTLQVFTDTISSIDVKLAGMLELAGGSAGSNWTYIPSEKTVMQSEFEQLAQDVNSLVAGAKSGTNALVSGAGRTIVVSLGKGSEIRIYPTDLSVQENLSISPGGPGLEMVEQAKEQTTYYRKYLGEKIELLEEAALAADSGIADDAGTHVGVDRVVTLIRAAEAVKEIVEQTELLADIQAHVSAEVALRLLTA